MITVETRGLEKLNDKLSKVPAALRHRLRAATLDAGHMVEEEAKTVQIRNGGYERVRAAGRSWIVLTPRPVADKVTARRGGLRRSISTVQSASGNTIEARVGTNLRYGRTLEEGAPATSFAPRLLPLAVITGDVSAKGFRWVSKRGKIRARHWLFKSLRAREREMFARIDGAVDEALNE